MQSGVLALFIIVYKEARLECRNVSRMKFVQELVVKHPQLINVDCMLT